jgi:LysR family transcriptional regulator, carnitine catabolism transcriptional activator
MEFTSRQLRAFLLVAQHHSFTRAAGEMFITPSGISLLIRELENQLGFRLFDRTTRHVMLTAHGDKLLPIARRNVRELDTAMGDLGKSAQQASQSLTIGAPPLVAANILPQAIKEFKAQRHDLHIQLSDGNLATIMGGVQSGSLDIGLGVFGKAPGVIRTPFFRFSLMVIRPDDDALPHRASTTWSALKHERLVVLPSSSPLQQVVDRHVMQSRVVAQSRSVVNSLDLQIAMVEVGEGIAVIPSFGLPVCRNRRVIMSRLINPVVKLDFHQIRNRGRKLPPGTEDFASFLQRYMSRWAGRSGIL